MLKVFLILIVLVLVMIGMLISVLFLFEAVDNIYDGFKEIF